MSAVAIVEGVMEGLELLQNLTAAAATVSSAVKSAQTTGTPLDLTAVLAGVDAAENNVLKAIADAQAAGR